MYIAYTFSCSCKNDFLFEYKNVHDIVTTISFTYVFKMPPFALMYTMEMVSFKRKHPK